jgi:predicted DNA-binding transcriptional regulator AlpA
MREKTMTDRIIWRSELRELTGVKTEAIRRWIAAKKLPPPDVALSKRTKGWRLSTLEAAGIRLL